MEKQNHDRELMILAGCCAILTSFTTFLLWLLPKLYETPASFLEGAQLANNVYYQSRLWVNFMHIPLALIAYWGLAHKLRSRELPKVTLGMIWFSIWGTVEMVGLSGIIFAVNKNWRTNYLTASDSTKKLLEQNVENYFALWDGMFFVLLIAFLLGTSFFGWATWKGKGLEKILSYLFWLAVPLTLLIIISGYFGFSQGDGLIEIFYPVLQPVSRFLLGLYLLNGIIGKLNFK